MSQVAPIESQEPPVRVGLTINQPKAAEMYYNTCVKIDHHNKRRHDTLRLEIKVNTNDWSKRVNQIILGIILVDTFLCYNQLVDDSEKEVDFYLRLAEELIDNKYYSIQLHPRNGTAEQTPSLDAIGKDGRPRSGIFIHLNPKNRKRKGSITALHQGRCKICKVKSSPECSFFVDKNDGLDYYICHSKSGRDCFAQHIYHTHEERD